jgi:hypothetical protein
MPNDWLINGGEAAEPARELIPIGSIPGLWTA